tara:strand:- start:1476 stop:1811 length:336 start_codon:yes stop_codon:yes gene_type:complete
MQTRLIEKYRVGGGRKTNGAHESRWAFGNHEVRVRVRRGNWQYYMHANARISGTWDVKEFPEWLEVRCPTMTDDELIDVKNWITEACKEDDDKRPAVVTNEPFMKCSRSLS